MSRLGLGLAAVGRPGYITLGRSNDLPAERTPAALSARATELLDTARTGGVRYFDVARSYGRAEEFLARWLEERRVPRQTATVGSKWGYRYTAGWAVKAPVHEEKELSLDRFTSQLAESRALLGDWLDLYQIHSATLESGCLDDEPLRWSAAGAVAGIAPSASRSPGRPRRARSSRGSMPASTASASSTSCRLHSTASSPRSPRLSRARTTQGSESS